MSHVLFKEMVQVGQLSVSGKSMHTPFMNWLRSQGTGLGTECQDNRQNMTEEILTVTINYKTITTTIQP